MTRKLPGVLLGVLTSEVELEEYRELPERCGPNQGHGHEGDGARWTASVAAVFGQDPSVSLSFPGGST
jgi:hypothetical protein